MTKGVDEVLNRYNATVEREYQETLRNCRISASEGYTGKYFQIEFEKGTIQKLKENGFEVRRCNSIRRFFCGDTYLINWTKD